MKNKLIVRIAEGLGNQLFMYAHAYCLSKKINYDLYIDNTSGYFKKKNQIRSYELDKFKIDHNLPAKKYKFDTFFLNLNRNLLKKIDIFKKKKSFLIEQRDENKISNYINTSKGDFSDLLYVEGHYESEKYFKDFANDLKVKFTVKENYIKKNNKFIELIKNNNSVSICIRQHRYSEGSKKNEAKSAEFTKNTINYINKAVSFFKNKISNPKFFIWSNDFADLNNYFNENEFTFIENDNNKSINDFNLFKYSKHFIVGPTPFHWWGAWLNQNPDKICVRPSGDLNPSNNNDFWPESWISI
jgi:hypothetical protein